MKCQNLESNRDATNTKAGLKGGMGTKLRDNQSLGTAYETSGVLVEATTIHSISVAVEHTQKNRLAKEVVRNSS
jgi:hypothetical protein